MGYETSLDLKATFNKKDFEPVKNLIKTFNDFDSKDNYWQGFRSLVSDYINSNPNHEEFVSDERMESVLHKCHYFDSKIGEDTVILLVECEIKDYTDTYEKFYKLLMNHKPITLDIVELPDGYETANKYSLKEGMFLIQTQVGKHEE